MMKIKIEKMAECHIESLAQIETECFSTPWSGNSLREELNNGNARFFVATCNNTVAGYVGAHNVVGEVYITNVAVKPEFRRKGIGKTLVAHLVDVCNTQGAEFVTLEVRKSNESAKSLYEKLGFKAVGTRKNFYEKPCEDAVLMSKFLKE